MISLDARAWLLSEAHLVGRREARLAYASVVSGEELDEEARTWLRGVSAAGAHAAAILQHYERRDH